MQSLANTSEHLQAQYAREWPPNKVKNEGKPTFELLNNMHVEVTADKANVNSFTGAFQEQWDEV